MIKFGKRPSGRRLSFRGIKIIKRSRGRIPQVQSYAYDKEGSSQDDNSSLTCSDSKRSVTVAMSDHRKDGESKPQATHAERSTSICSEKAVHEQHGGDTSR